MVRSIIIGSGSREPQQWQYRQYEKCSGAGAGACAGVLILQVGGELRCDEHTHTHARARVRVYKKGKGCALHRLSCSYKCSACPWCGGCMVALSTDITPGSHVKSRTQGSRG